MRSKTQGFSQGSLLNRVSALGGPSTGLGTYIGTSWVCRNYIRYIQGFCGSSKGTTSLYPICRFRLRLVGFKGSIAPSFNKPSRT